MAITPSTCGRWSGRRGRRRPNRPTGSAAHRHVAERRLADQPGPSMSNPNRPYCSRNSSAVTAPGGDHRLSRSCARPNSLSDSARRRPQLGVAADEPAEAPRLRRRREQHQVRARPVGTEHRRGHLDRREGVVEAGQVLLDAVVEVVELVGRPVDEPRRPRRVGSPLQLDERGAHPGQGPVQRGQRVQVDAPLDGAAGRRGRSRRGPRRRSPPPPRRRRSCRRPPSGAGRRPARTRPRPPAVRRLGRAPPRAWPRHPGTTARRPRSRPTPAARRPARRRAIRRPGRGATAPLRSRSRPSRRRRRGPPRRPSPRRRGAPAVIAGGCR